MKILRNKEAFTPKDIFKNPDGSVVLSVGCEQVVVDAASLAAMNNAEAPPKKEPAIWVTWDDRRTWFGPYTKIWEVGSRLMSEDHPAASVLNSNQCVTDNYKKLKVVVSMEPPSSGAYPGWKYGAKA